ncbi:hypothetical protein K502DRAFT_365137 [Neoconidiobolus thromboides FSU 785]|nr:hypothetical protein K502DRAFT_365137 [Neoconidiobolus thromboides FSU 785]
MIQNNYSRNLKSKMQGQSSHDDPAISIKDKYKNAKYKLKALEKKNENALEELRQAEKEIKRLRNIQRKSLNRLAEKQMDLEPTSEEDNSEIHDPEMIKRYQNSGTLNNNTKSKSVSNKKNEKGSEPGNKGNTTKAKKKSRQDREGPRKVMHIPRDDDGNIILPCKVGIYTILDLGTVDYNRETFHSPRYIYPIGLKIMRYYRSTVNPHAQACYTASIEDNGTGPIFQVVGDDNPKKFVSDTSSGAWAQVIKEATKVRNLTVTNSGSGPEFYGLAHPTIAYMIQSLPNSEKCKNYKTQLFEFLPATNQSRTWVAPPLPNKATPPTIEPEDNLSRHDIEPPIVEPEYNSSKLDVTPQLEEAIEKPNSPPRRRRIWE